VRVCGVCEQLAEWAERAGAELCPYEKDMKPAAVLYRAVEYSSRKESTCDILIADTSGSACPRPALVTKTVPLAPYSDDAQVASRDGRGFGGKMSSRGRFRDTRRFLSPGLQPVPRATRTPLKCGLPLVLGRVYVGLSGTIRDIFHRCTPRASEASPGRRSNARLVF
jgi:hypothetical protein